MGFLLLCIGIASLLFLIKIEKKGVHSPGKIISYETSSRGYKTPVVEYKTIEKNSILNKPFLYASTNIDPDKSKIDKEVLVQYDSDKPERFILVEEKIFTSVIHVVVLVIGLLFTVLGVCNLLGVIKFGK